MPPFIVSSASLEENGGIHPFVAIHSHQHNLASYPICQPSELPFSLAHSLEQFVRPSRMSGRSAFTRSPGKFLRSPIFCLTFSYSEAFQDV